MSNNTFTANEKIEYALKTALLITTSNPYMPSNQELLAPPRVFPNNVNSKDLITLGEGDIGSDGKYVSGHAEAGVTADLNIPWNTVKQYRIIDPHTRKTSGKTIATLFVTNSLTAGPNAANSTYITASDGNFDVNKVYDKWYYRYYYPASGTDTEKWDAANIAYTGLNLAFNSVGSNVVVNSGSSNEVPHLKVYLQVQTNMIPGSNIGSKRGQFSDTTEDSISFFNPLMKNMCGPETLAQAAVHAQQGTHYGATGTGRDVKGIGYAVNEWYVQPTAGMLSFYALNKSGEGTMASTTFPSKSPFISFVRYTGATGTLGGGGGGGSATTLNALTDVTSSGATDGQALVWDNAASTWKPGSVAAASGGGGATTLNALTDVTSSGATDGQALVWDNTASTWKPGSVAAASGGGGGGGSYDTVSLDRKGQVLEILTGVCDGRSVTVESGTYTLPVGTKQQLSGDPFVDVNGTNISYKPPSGTKQVVYSMLIHIGAIISGHTDMILNFIVLLDGNEITKSLITERPGNKWAQGWIDVQFVFDIGNVSSDDYANGKLASWNSNRTIKVMGREGHPGSFGGWINSNHNVHPSGGSGGSDYGAGQVYPQMTIKAIGDESISVGVSALTKENSLTIPNFTGTYTTNKLYNQSDRLKFNGETILTSNNPTINLKGQVLETLAGIFDGRSVSVASGTYTLKDVTAVQTVAGVSGGSFEDHVGTDINYKPPAGTRQVKITYTVATDVEASLSHANETHPRFRLVIDGTVFTSQQMAEQEAYGYYNATHNRVFILDVGSVSSDDIANGKLASWNTSRNIKLQVGAEGYTTSYNITRKTVSHGTVLLKPSIEITAIGEGLVGVQKVVNVLGPGGIRNISDIHMNPNNEIDWSSDHGSGSGYQFSGTAAFHSNQIYHDWSSAWRTDSPLYNTTTGVYTGSQLTGTLAGEWLQIKFPSKATIHKIGIQSLGHGDNDVWNAPKSFVLFGSNDGTSFNNLGQFTVAHIKEYIHDDAAIYNHGGSLRYNQRLVYRALSSPQTYQYFRLVITQNFGNHTNYSEITSGATTGAVNIAYMAYYGTLESEYANIGDLSDVSDSVSTATTGQTLIYNGSEWVPGAATASGSVVVSTAFDGGGALKLTEFSGTSTTSKLYNDTSSGENVLKFDGKTVLTGEGINRKGQVLETLVGVCDGRSITVASGTYTLENVNAKQSLTAGSGNSGNFVKVNGSLINYKPPSGTHQIIYEYTVHLNKLLIGHPIGLWKLFVDSTEVTNFTSNTSADHLSVQQTFMYVFEIGETNDIANGKLSSWDTLKTIKLEASAWHSSHHVDLHETSYGVYSDTSTRTGGALSPPKLKIQAIGEGVVSVGRNITAITRNLKRRISHPNDGLVLAYHCDISDYDGSYDIEHVFQSGLVNSVGGHSNSSFTSANGWNWLTSENRNTVGGHIGTFIGAQFSEKFVFTSIVIQPRAGSGYAPSCPRVFYIYGSNDRVNWDLIFSKSLPDITVTSNQNPAGPYTVGSDTIFEIPDNGVGYKNFHMVVTRVYTQSNATIANFNVYKLDIYGYEADITASIANLKDVDTISAQPEIGQGLLWNGNKWVPGKQVNEGVALDGQVLEVLAGVCDGSTVTVSSGSYTLENVTLKQTMQDTYLAVSGSSVNYKPPSGTNKIIYNFYTIVRPKQTAGTVRLAFEYRLYVDGTEISSYNAGIYENYKGGGAPSSEFNPSFVLTIGEKNDVANGHFLSWDSNKVVEIRARSFDGSNGTDDGVTFHEYWWNLASSGSTGTSGPALFVKPRLEIQAIGNKLYQPAQIVRTLEGGDGTKNISDLNMYQGYEITSSGYHNSSTNNNYRPEIAFFTEEGGGSGSWHSLSGKYDTNSGNYTGSTSTNGYNGEWIQINFGKKAKVYHYGMRPQGYNQYHERSPRDYKLFGSNDGSVWTEVHTGSAVESDYGLYGWPMKRNTLSTPATYQYFRLVVNSLVGGGQTQII